MKKNKKVISKNYLEGKPMQNPQIKWSCDSDGMVILEIENKGIANKLAQILLKKPKVSYIHLDENGSFVWQQINGVRTIIEIGELVENQFGEKAHPLYERLAQFFKTLERYGFVTFSK